MSIVSAKRSLQLNYFRAMKIQNLLGITFFVIFGNQKLDRLKSKPAGSEISNSSGLANYI